MIFFLKESYDLLNPFQSYSICRTEIIDEISFLIVETVRFV